MIALGIFACFSAFDTNLEQVKDDTILCHYDKRISKHQESNDDIWRYAHMGDYNLTHKRLLERKQNTMDELYCNFLIMAYMYYQMGEEREMRHMFASINRFIEGNARSESE